MKALTVGQRLAGIIGLAVVVAAMLVGLGMLSLSASNASLKTVYEDRTVPAGDLGKIATLLVENRAALRTALSQVHIDTTGKEAILAMDQDNSAKAADKIGHNLETIAGLWKGYMATHLTPEEKIQADKYIESRNTFLNEALKPAIAALRENDHSKTLMLADKVRELYKPAFEGLEALIKLQMDVAKAEYDAGIKRYDQSRLISFSALGGAIAILAWFGFAVSRSIKGALGGEPGQINDVAKRIAAGELSFTIPLSANDKNSAMAAMVSMQSNIKLLVSEAAALSQATVEGRLSVRADVSKHQGDYQKVIEGVNATLNAVVDPLNMAATYVDNLSKGVIPPEITASYNGDFVTIKNNLNACGSAIKALVADGNLLATATAAGVLTTRADGTKHFGEYRKVIEGLNATMDALVNPLNMAASYVDNLSKGVILAEITASYNGDFNIIKNNLNACGNSIKALVADGNLLAQAAEAGDLTTRVDAAKHLGEYRKVIEGLNATLNAIAKPLNMAATNLDNIARGDIPAEITEHFNGDFNNIKDNLNTCIQSINALVTDTNLLAEAASEGRIQTRADASQHQGDFRKIIEGVNATLETIVAPIIAVQEAVETINTAAGEISSGNNDLSQRTEQQASTLEETAASMEELAATVKNNAENAKQANQLSLTASSVAVKGGEVVAEVVGTMSAINASAKKIEDIISVIDGIAFQTNILALNAAVEAARAGEQGRGFAVVAGEVRNLAQRSASAAKEIKELISDSVTKTAEGTKQVENAGKTMEEVVTSVKRVADIISEIAAASVEQSQGITQVNHAVTTLDEATQQNAALVEQAAAAAMSLVEQANALTDVVSVFKLDSHVSKNKRALKSPLRTIPSNARVASPKPVVKLVIAKTASDNSGDWEEF